MINRIRAYDRRRKQNSAFPLLDPTWQFLKHPPLVIGVGEPGQAAVERARTLRASHHSEDLLTAPLADADIRHAVTTLRQSLHGERSLALGNRLEVVLIGHCEAIESALAELRTTIETVDEEIPIHLVTLEIGGAPETSPYCLAPFDTEMLFGRFRLARQYQLHGALTEEQQVELAARLIENGTHLELLRFAATRRGVGEVLLGAALGWLPEVALGEAVARYITRDVARQIASPPEALRPKRLGPFPLAELRAQLESQLTPEVEELVSQLKDAYRNEPITEVASDAHAGRAISTEMLDAWTKSVVARVRQTLTSLLSASAGFHSVQAAVDQAIEELESARRMLAQQEASLVRKRRQASHEVRELDERRLASRRCRIPVWRQAVVALRTRSTRRRLREFGRIRSDELSTHYQGIALRRVQEALQAIQARLLQVAAQASGVARQTMDELLRPQHPNLVSRQDVRTLERFLQSRVDLLSSLNRNPLLVTLWSRTAERLLRAEDDGAGKKPWEHVQESVAELANAVPEADRPLAVACQGLLPRYRPAGLTSLLTELARPQGNADALVPWAEVVVVQDESGANVSPSRDRRSRPSTRMPAVVTFRWRAAQERDGESARIV